MTGQLSSHQVSPLYYHSTTKSHPSSQPSGQPTNHPTMKTMSSAFRQFQPPQLIAALLLQQGKSRHIPSAFLPTPAQPKPIESTLMAPARHLSTIQISSCIDYRIPTAKARGSHHKERPPFPLPSFFPSPSLHTSVPMSTT